MCDFQMGCDPQVENPCLVTGMCKPVRAHLLAGEGGDSGGVDRDAELAHRGTGGPLPVSAPGLPPQRAVASSFAAAAARPPGLLWADPGVKCSPSVWMLERKAEVSGGDCQEAQTTHKRSEHHRGNLSPPQALV